ncbi:MAG: glycoside hydrolase family 130 protein [Burkholderiales bacterium]|nr:glycoside hydrolase family 130 protein [Burkholderiales bacterium]
MSSPVVNRTAIFINPDRARVLIRPFRPASEQRIVKIIARLLALPEADIEALLGRVMADFSERHKKTQDLVLERFESVRAFLVTDLELSEARRVLIGSYFSHEYALEAAALFNPSITPHPDQSDLPPGALRFVLSLRATGEGHVSSITFRTGVIDAALTITVNTPTRFVTEARAVPEAPYAKALFARQLAELGFAGDFTRRTLAALDDPFILAELRAALVVVENQLSETPGVAATSGAILAHALSNHQVRFAPGLRMSERVIFPRSPSQSNGIEDARFVAFTHEDGTRTYFATYTAYDGRSTFPQLLETRDFLDFTFITLAGPAVQNKGMALFPRQVGGRYVMLGRQDNENIFILFSDDLHFWRTSALLLKPTYAWEFVQLGNCGSPIETERGWLVLSHGVGAMRKYSIGAFLLDLEDPTTVIGRLREPLITPAEDEREGYVPNVVYSCGALLHGRELIIPYAVSDYATRFATVSLDAVLDAMA